ncbi:MAG: ABC transporter permease [Myxococcales bacterium]|nr:ABC transporter permease [Myxococcales bacterium]
MIWLVWRVVWFTVRLALAYLRARRRSSATVIAVISVVAVALGVGALLAVLSIASGFQQAFRDKVLGVNAHVLVLEYGLDFDEYREVIARAMRMPEVAGAAPFVIHEMMLAHGDRIAGVLVKGVDPERMPTVLDVPRQLVDGSLDGLRVPGALPPLAPEALEEEPDDDLEAFLAELARQGPAAGASPTSSAENGARDESSGDEALRERIARGEDLFDPPQREAGEPSSRPSSAVDGTLRQRSGVEPPPILPTVEVPSLAEAERLLRALEREGVLPGDESERAVFEEEQRIAEAAEREARTGPLPGILVGVSLAHSLGLRVGDEVRLISPLAGLDTSPWSGARPSPRSRPLRVTGIFEAGFHEYDTRLVYVDLYEAQRFLDRGDTVTGVEIRLHDLDEAPRVAASLEEALGDGAFYTMDWKQLNQPLFEALEVQRIVLAVVIATIIVVAAFCVVATLIMMVLEKKRDIAILKAMGASDRAILAVFSLQGTAIGVAGTLLGALLGGGAAKRLEAYRFPLDPKVYLIDHLPVRLSWLELGVTVAVALVICTTATLGPSGWAARQLPAEGVRHE